MTDRAEETSLAETDDSSTAGGFLDEHRQLERVLTLVKAGLASTPFAGGISSLLTDVIPSRRFRRMERLIEQALEDLARLSDRVSEDRLQSEHYSFVLEQALKGAADNYQEEKLAAFRAILANAAIASTLEDEEQEYFIGLVNRLSALHLRILRFLAEPRRYLSDIDVDPDQFGGGFTQMFSVAIPNVSTDVVKSAFTDLYDAGLTNTNSSIFSTMTATSGLQLLGDRVTQLGRRFIDFLTQPSDRA